MRHAPHVSAYSKATPDREGASSGLAERKIYPGRYTAVHIMLLVVFGAGASYDSVPAYPASRVTASTHLDEYSRSSDRLPLANQLFENREEFAQDMSHFPQCRPITSYLLPNQDGISLERVLQKLQDEAAEYPARHRQLAAIRYYLQVMLRRCEQRWIKRAPGGATNQITMLDQIERWRKPDEQVCIVTFNYDLMLETALSALGILIGTISDYVADSKYKLIKLHGSVNWGRQVRAPDELLQKDVWSLVHTLIEDANSLEITQDYRLVDQSPIHASDGSVLFPAIAIPVETKVNYECPDEHLEALHAAIPEVDKLMVIGWRAAETPFLEFLANNLRQEVQGFVVAGGSDAANETVHRLQSAGVNGDYVVTDGGFTEFVVERQADEFLSG